MICIILSLLLFIANHFVNSGKPKTSKKPLLWLAGISILAIAAISISIYIIAPPLLASLGFKPAYDCVSDYNVGFNTASYCGAYCTNKSAPKPPGNCTCLMY